MNLSNDQKDRIVKLLSSRLGTIKCPMCGRSSGFDLFDSEVQTLCLDKNQSGQIDFSNIRYIPTFVLVCKSCGYISHFNAGQYL